MAMFSLAGEVPKMDWSAEDLEAEWKAFKQHVDFMFTGPLKGKSEVENAVT